MNLKHGYGLPKREEHYRVKITPCGEGGGTGEVATKEYVEEKCDNVVVEVNNTINSLIVEAPKGANKNYIDNADKSILGQAKVYTDNFAQDFEERKAEYKLKVVAKDHVSQMDAREVLTYLDQYDGKLIEFMTNGDMPNKAVATGRVFTDENRNAYLVTYNIDGTTTVWNKDNFEEHNVGAFSYINEPMVDMDNFTIDVAGKAPYVANVNGAKNKPENTSNNGIIIIIAYNINNQIQFYIDASNGKLFKRIVTGTADSHSFSVWDEYPNSDTIKALEERIKKLENKNV